MKAKANAYPWKFSSVGGTVRVTIERGEDIRQLGQLDRKLWTVLSCPVQGLEFDEKTLRLIDADQDGKIRVDEVIATAQWLTRIVKNPDILLQEADSLSFEDFNTEDPDGARLLASARQILKNLKLEKDSIALEDTADNVKIFADTRFNGDGVITAASAGEEEALAALIADIAGAMGATTDRSGAPGVTAEQIEAFYAACADYAAWKAAGTPDVFPYGDKTADALAAVDAVKAKVADYFMRCSLVGFDAAIAPAVDVNADKIAGIDGNLSDAVPEIGAEPLAKPAAGATLPLKEGLNPAWEAAVKAMAALVAPDKDALTETEWKAIVASFAPYTAWLDAKKGVEAEALGLDKVEAILKEDKKAALLELVAADKAEEANALSIEEVDKVLRLNKNFYRFLNNYVVLADFYDPSRKAVFQAGRLYIDQRSTDLCVKVAGPAPEISSLSGMYILYCACTSERLGKSFNIAAVLTDGDVDGLREGKNAVFYDREGNDYTAKVTSIVDNPISIRQAFWAPYKKVARWISDKIDKKASAKNDAALGNLTTAADKATDGKGADAATAVKPGFDVGKIAGITIAAAAVSGVLVALVATLKSLTWWQWLVLIGVVMLLISGPSMFIAWRKLRKRDLGPILNANGWAVNAASLVNVKFGKTLTSLARFPKLTAVDPEARRKARCRRFWCCLCVVLLIAVGLWLFNVLSCCGLNSPLKCYQQAPAEECVADEAPAAEEEAAALPAEVEEAPAAE